MADEAESAMGAYGMPRQKGLVIETRRRGSATASSVPPTLPPPPHLHSVSSSAMSEKLKEFVEIPQEFVHDGQQVRCPHGAGRTCSEIHPVVPHSLHEAFAERFARLT